MNNFNEGGERISEIRYTLSRARHLRSEKNPLPKRCHYNGCCQAGPLAPEEGTQAYLQTAHVLCVAASSRQDRLLADFI